MASAFPNHRRSIIMALVETAWRTILLPKLHPFFEMSVDSLTIGLELLVRRYAEPKDRQELACLYLSRGLCAS